MPTDYTHAPVYDYFINFCIVNILSRSRIEICGLEQPT